MALATNAGNLAVEFFARFCARRTTLLIAAATVLAIATAAAGLADSFWTVLAMLLLLNAAQGVGGPIQRAYLHTIAPSAERATVASAVSLVGGAGGIGGQLGLGWIARTHSLAGGYLTAGLTLLIAVPPLLSLRRIAEPADTIIGRQPAGHKGACPGQDIDPQLLSLKRDRRPSDQWRTPEAAADSPQRRRPSPNGRPHAEVAGRIWLTTIGARES
jgi:MFS family permease